MEIDELRKAFGDKEIPKALIALLNFDNTVSTKDWFSAGFEFSVDEENYMLKTYSENDEFLKSLIQFAQADATGSTYAFWINNVTKSLDDTPIVAFGSEGGYHVVAENIYDFLRILTYDAQPMINWNSIHYYKDEADYEPSTYNEEYRNWLEKNHQIVPTKNADEIVRNAKAKYQEEFKIWIGKYYSE